MRLNRPLVLLIALALWAGVLVAAPPGVPLGPTLAVAQASEPSAPGGCGEAGSKDPDLVFTLAASETSITATAKIRVFYPRLYFCTPNADGVTYDITSHNPGSGGSWDANAAFSVTNLTAGTDYWVRVVNTYSYSGADNTAWKYIRTLGGGCRRRVAAGQAGGTFGNRA